MPRNIALKTPKYWWIILGALIGILAIFGFGINKTTAVQTPGGRYRTVEVEIKQFIWNVMSQSTGKQLCEITIEYDRKPSDDEILAACADLFVTIIRPTAPANATPLPAIQTYDSKTFIANIYLTPKEQRSFKRTVKIPLQDMVTNIIVPDETTSSPFVIVAAFEPETDYHITAIYITMNGQDYICNHDRCRIPIQRDTSLEFWASSSMGDESEHAKATVRVSIRAELTKRLLNR